MDHDLAMELIAGGYPYWEEGEVVKMHCGKCRKAYDAPDLEHLIEACGVGFFTMNSTQSRESAIAWFAGLSDGTKPLGGETGSTPTEAVARLWLALHKKSAPVAESA